ncbi:hypothetical protein L1887_16493 [Cichorium endivia]|nr:hypothetical protein L1887_16493 [Cichorium endivia]
MPEQIYTRRNLYVQHWLRKPDLRLFLQLETRLFPSELLEELSELQAKLKPPYVFSISIQKSNKKRRPKFVPLHFNPHFLSLELDPEEFGLTASTR